MKPDVVLHAIIIWYLLLLEGLGLLYYIGEISFLFIFYFFVNVKKIVLIHFLFDLKNSCSYFRAMIYINAF